LCNGIRINRSNHLFVKVPQSRDSELKQIDLFGFRVKLPPVTIPVYPLTRASAENFPGWGNGKPDRKWQYLASSKEAQRKKD